MEVNRDFIFRANNTENVLELTYQTAEGCTSASMRMQEEDLTEQIPNWGLVKGTDLTYAAKHLNRLYLQSSPMNMFTVSKLLRPFKSQ